MDKEYNILDQYGIEMKQFSRIDFEEEKRLGKAIQNGDLKARDKLVTSNLKLVPYIATKYIDGCMSLADMVSEGNRGLILAANKFDYRIGVRFSTFAYWQIKEAITTALKNETKWVSVIELKHEFTHSTNQNDSDEQSDKCINKIDKTSLQLHSDNENDKNELELTECIFKDVLFFLDELSPKESSIIKHYFGIEEHTELNVTELSKMYNLSSMRVSKIINDSIRKIRCKYMEKIEY